MLNLVLLLIFIMCVAALWFQGLWSNVVTLINLLLAMMFAFNYFEPWRSCSMAWSRPTPTCGTSSHCGGCLRCPSALLRVMTDMLSRTRVVFDFWVETVGRSIIGVWIAWLFIGFICATMHTAPLGPHPLGFQPTPKSGNFLGMAPTATGWRSSKAGPAEPCRGGVE